jgi:hypothetical protein
VVEKAPHTLGVWAYTTYPARATIVVIPFSDVATGFVPAFISRHRAFLQLSFFDI